MHRVPLDYLPNEQCGYVQVGQSRHRPPTPSLTISRRDSRSPVSIRGANKSKAVVLEYITHPGNPMMGISPI